MTTRVTRLLDHPRAPLVAWLVMVTLVVVAIGGYGDSLRRIDGNQQRIAVNQRGILEQQERIDDEVADRIEAVCQTAVDTRMIVSEVIRALEAASPESSTLQRPGVRDQLAAILRSRPVQCERAGVSLSDP